MKNNTIFDEINDKSIKLFEKCLPILNSEKRIKIEYYDLLYGDIIKNTDNKNKDKDKDIIFDIDYNESIIDDYSNGIYNKKSNLQLEIQEMLQSQLQALLKKTNDKIKECNTHIEILKLEYKNILLGKQIIVNKNVPTKLIFNNKTVLYNKDHKLKLGEFFARFLFCLYDSNNSTDLLNLSQTFYDSAKIESFIEDDTNKTVFKVKKFEDISINFKYFIIMIILVKNLFESSSNYNILFNIVEFQKHISLLTAKDKPKKENKKKNKDKDKKKGGDGSLATKNEKNFVEGVLSKDNTKNKKSNKKTEKKPEQKGKNNTKSEQKNEGKEERNKYLALFSDKDTLYKIRKAFDNKTKPYITSITASNTGKIDNPFDETKPLDQVYYKKDKEGKTQDYTIFQALFLLLKDDNKKFVEKFIEDIKNNFILLLFYLYNIKKRIYIYFITSISNKFNIVQKINNTSVLSSNNSSMKKNNKTSSSEETVINNSVNNSTNNKEIRKYEKELHSLKRNENYDEKALEIENKIKKLLIEEYEKYK
jgi:hypothetical protein